MKKLLTWSAPLLVAILLLAGCGATDDTSKTTNEEQAATETVQQYPMKMKDSTGETIEFKEQPEKVVSLIPSNTEILYELGAGDTVIGVSDLDNYPEEVTKKERIGAMEFNLEKIISLNPDVVLAHDAIGGSTDAGMQQLRDLGITVFYIPEATNFNETYDTITQVGLIMNKNNEAKKVIQEMQDKVAAVQKKIGTVETERSAFIETSDEPEIYTAGKGTFIQEMFDLLSIKNIATKDNWYQISSEAIITDNPDVILVMYDYVPNIEEKVKKRTGFETVNAVINDRVVQIDSDQISRTGPRLADGLEEIAKAVYPEAFE